jgi:hypothetical protein
VEVKYLRVYFEAISYMLGRTKETQKNEPQSRQLVSGARSHPRTT